MKGAGVLIGALMVMAGNAQADLSQILERFRQVHNVPGFALVTVDKSGITGTYTGGLADRNSERPMTAETLIRIGSITKTFNSLAALRLESEGRWSIQDKLADIAPLAPYENPWRDSNPIRIVHLMDHAAGFTDLTRTEMAHNTPFDSVLTALNAGAANRVVQWPAGLYSEYSNVNAGYLGYALEQVTAEPYEQLMRDLVLHPLGLTSASLEADETTLKRLATGYDSDGQSPIPYWHMYLAPLGAINATAREMAALPLLMIRRGRLENDDYLPAEQIERMESPQSTLAARQRLKYGLGLGTDQEIRGGRVWHGHLGDGDGYLSQFAYQKDLGVGYFLTINSFNHDALRLMKAAVSKALSAGMKSPKATPAMADGADAIPLADYVGAYRQITWRFGWRKPDSKLSLLMKGERLFIRYGDGQALPLVRTGPGLFRHPVEPVSTMAISHHEGDWILQGEFGSFRRISSK
ncbi:MAG: serine hydrolase domain-containing protein [Gammaproteobacteria bacterium]